MSNEYKQLIKNIMKSYSFKSVGGIYYIKLNNNFIILEFAINKSTLYSSIYIKKISYDDLYWKILNKEDLASKSDSERVNGAYHIVPILVEKYTDDLSTGASFEDVIQTKIHQIVDEIKNRICLIDVNYLIVNGNYKSRIKCIALIDMGFINEAISLAKEEKENGNNCGVVINGVSFPELLISKYEVTENKAIPDENVTTVNSSTNKIIDNYNWHLNSESAATQEMACTHITYFFVWLVENKAIVYEDNYEHEIVETTILSKQDPVSVFLDYFDGRLLISDIILSMRDFVVDYYDSNYYKDYEKFLNKNKYLLYNTEFNWDSYSEMAALINNRYKQFHSVWRKIVIANRKRE